MSRPRAHKLNNGARQGMLRAMIRRFIFLAAVWGGTGCAPSASAEAGNLLAFHSLDEHVASIALRLTDYRIDDQSIVAEIPGAIRVDREASDLPPAFVYVQELDEGRMVEVEEINTADPVSVRSALADRVTGDNDVVSATLARMGSRVFVRVEVRPFQPAPDGRHWMVYESLNAIIRVSNRPPPPRVKAVDVLVAPAAEGGTPCATCPPPVSVGVSPGSGGTAVEFAPHRSVTNRTAWKINMSQAGLYRITGADLAVAGVPESYRNTESLRLSSRDHIVPFWRSTAGPMQNDDWLMFYGAPVHAQSTTQNVYWLSVDHPSPEPALRSVVPSDTLPLVTSAWQTARYAPKNFYKAAYNPLVNSYDHWFALEITGGTTSNISLATPYPLSTGEAYLAYALHGVNATTAADPDHRSVLRVGAHVADTREYNGQVLVSGTSSVPASAVSPGTTFVSVEQAVPPGVPHPSFSTGFIESLHLCYQRELIADTLPLYFKGPADPGQVRLTGIPTNTCWLLDVSDPLSPMQLQDYSLVADGGTWTLDFEDDDGGGRCYALFTDADTLTAPSVELVRFRNLSDTTRQADYLVITPEAFREPIYRLLRHRYKNGLAVQVATPEDVYNEFSYGLIDPVAIRQYFGYTYHHVGSDAPRYALLVGSGSYDPLNNLGLGGAEHIPARMGPSPWRRTALEQWFVTVDGPSPDDLLPDISLGRIPADTVDQVERLVNKIIAYEVAPSNAGWRESALLVADDADAQNDFKAHVEGNTKPHLENGGFDPLFGIQTAFRDDDTQAQVTQAIESELNGGVQFIHYMGHGGVHQWSSPSVWNSTDAASSANTVHPLVMVFTCQNGIFYDPTEVSLSQAMLLGQGGASGMVAPTALSVQLFSEKLADGFYEALAVDRVERLGDAMQEGFLRLWTFNEYVAELQFYTILGDPAQQVWGGAVP